MRKILIGLLIVALFFGVTLWALDFFSGSATTKRPKIAEPAPLKPVARPGKPGTIERHVLFQCPDGALLTPAVLDADGGLWCASAARLYRLTASFD